MPTFKDINEVSTVLECILSKTVLTSATSLKFSKTVFTSTTSLKVDIQRWYLRHHRLRMPTFKDVADVSTVFESCSLSKMMFCDPSLKFLSFNDIIFYDDRKTSLYPLFDRHRSTFF
ncbi:hypothetical protein HKD37_01G001538 [Glycine soja]